MAHIREYPLHPTTAGGAKFVPPTGTGTRTEATVLFKTILTSTIKRLKNIMQEIYPGNLSFSLTPYLAWPGVLPCTRVWLFARKRLVS